MLGALMRIVLLEPFYTIVRRDVYVQVIITC